MRNFCYLNGTLILYILLEILSVHLNLQRINAKTINLKAIKYCIINANMYWKDPLNILLLCITESEIEGIIDQFHAGIYEGHYSWRATAYKILRGGFYWPTLFLQVGAKVIGCIPCQMLSGKKKLATLPLVPSIVSTPFLQQGLDFIGEIHPTSSNQHRWILTTIDYFTKWVEAIPIRNVIDSVVIKFIEENILSRFCCELKLSQIMQKHSLVLK